MTQEKFEALHKTFSAIYVSKSANQFTGELAYISDSREALFFILYYLKVYPTWQVLGLSFGFTDVTAGGYIAYILPTLKTSLGREGALALREFVNQQAFDEAFADVTDIFIDGTEIPIERTENDLKQRKTYSGKKKPIR